MGPLHRGEAFPGTGELGGESLEFFEVKGRQCFEALGTVRGEMQSDNAMVFLVSGATDETCRVGTVNETDRAVMEKEQVVSHLSDGRTTRIAVPPHRQ